MYPVWDVFVQWVSGLPETQVMAMFYLVVIALIILSVFHFGRRRL